MKAGSATERRFRIPAYAAAVAVVMLVLFSCTREAHIPSTPGARLVVGFETTEYVSALQARVEYDPARFRFSGIVAAGEGVLAKPYDDGLGQLTLAMVSAEPIRGEIVEIVFYELGVGEAEAVQVTEHTAYDHEGRPVATVTTTETAEPNGQADLASTQEASVTVAQFDGGMRGLSTPLDLTLEPSFADYRLGDVNSDQTIDVLDVLGILNIAAGAIASPTDFEIYHSDLDNNGLIDTLDVLVILDKAVDPTLPARLHIAPRPVTFEHVTTDGPVLINNAGNETMPSVAFETSSGVSLSQLTSYGVTGHAAAYSVDVSGSWTNAYVDADAGSAGSISVAVGNITFLIAGQSNAAGYGKPMTDPEPGIPQVRMFGNDYAWKEAYEPLDDETGQVDPVSLEDPYDPSHSFGVRLGKALHFATRDRFDGVGRHVYLIPSAKQGSRVSDSTSWQPSSGRLDRGTLFGSANYRAQISSGSVSSASYEAEGGPVSAIAWYQGESDATTLTRRQDFIANTNTVMDAFRAELDGVPVLYVQLAVNSKAIVDNIEFQSLRERQRLMESGVPAVNTGSGAPQPRADFHMVVAHDLPMSDGVHVSAEGQRILAERLALAYREHVMGENVDGTGPRLEGITVSGRTIKIDTTRTINDHPTYEGYFKVFPASDPSTELDIEQIRRDPNDPTAVEITLTAMPTETVLVRYMPPVTRDTTVLLSNVIRDVSTGLPLPAFGSTIDLAN